MASPSRLAGDREVAGAGGIMIANSAGCDHAALYFFDAFVVETAMPVVLPC
jgi:hypothetical protein